MRSIVLCVLVLSLAAPSLRLGAQNAPPAAPPEARFRAIPAAKNIGEYMRRLSSRYRFFTRGTSGGAGPSTETLRFARSWRAAAAQISMNELSMPESAALQHASTRRENGG